MVGWDTAEPSTPDWDASTLGEIKTSILLLVEQVLVEEARVSRLLPGRVSIGLYQQWKYPFLRLELILF
jgi:hypothetical protein